jgi:hypothetical protein
MFAPIPAVLVEEPRRMESMLSTRLGKKIQSLSNQAARVRLGPEIRPERMKNDILRMARELTAPVTVPNAFESLIYQ